MRHLAFTGGFDSTFRLLQILENGDEVTPHYIGGYIDGRENTGSEIETMRSLHAALSAKYPGQLQPIQYVWEWPVDEKIVDGFQAVNRRLRLTQGIGHQYLVLSLYATGHGLSLEVCAEPGGRLWRYLKELQIPEEAGVLPNLGFPVIDKTKEEMMAWAEGHGLESYLLASHTCWRPPAPGTACGQCEMCKRRIAWYEPMEPAPYDVDVSICIPAMLAVGKAETTVKSAVESIMAMDTGKARTVEIIWAGSLNKQRLTKLEKLGSVVHVDTDSDDLAYLRNAASRAATGAVQVHLMPGMKFKGDSLAQGIMQAEKHKFWAPVPVNKGTDGSAHESTPQIPSGRGPWPLVAAPWWAFLRIGGWRSVKNPDSDFSLRARHRGITIARHVEDGITFPETI
jgi:hypothetical protein